MPHRKKRIEKPVHEMTDQELAAKVFHPKLLAKLNEIAHEGDSQAKSRSSKKG